MIDSLTFSLVRATKPFAQQKKNKKEKNSSRGNTQREQQQKQRSNRKQGEFTNFQSKL